MRSLIISIFGTYTPVTYSLNGVDVIADGFAGVDWEFISSVFLFGICLLSVFRLIGCLLKNA